MICTILLHVLTMTTNCYTILYLYSYIVKTRACIQSTEHIPEATLLLAIYSSYNYYDIIVAIISMTHV